MSNFWTQPVLTMIRNIYGDNASPLQGEVADRTSDPTLRIGLISDVPSAQDDERHQPNPTLGIGLRSDVPSAPLLMLTILLSVLFASCSARVVYDPQPITAASPNAININTGSADELEELPHIGRKTAEAIVDHRERHGAFRRVEHLMLIRGVSEARFKKIRNLIRIE